MPLLILVHAPHFSAVLMDYLKKKSFIKFQCELKLQLCIVSISIMLLQICKFVGQYKVQLWLLNCGCILV